MCTFSCTILMCNFYLLFQPSPQVDLSRYTELVRAAELGAGNLDLLGPVYAPRGNIQVYSPYLDVSAFNPRYKNLHQNKTNNRYSNFLKCDFS